MINIRIITCLPWTKLFTYCLLIRRSFSIRPQLKYIINIILELKVELAKIKTEFKELKKQLSVIYLSLVNEVRHNEKNYFQY